MTNKEPGFVYILTNPSFREDWVKIGKSSRPVDIRSKELDNTAVPLPFEIYATLQTVKYDVVEKKIHKAIDRLTDLRIRQNREFFNIKPELALEIFKDEAMILDDAIITMYENNQPIVPKVNGTVAGHKEQRCRLQGSQSPISSSAWLIFLLEQSWYSSLLVIKSKLQAMIRLNTRGAFINSLLLLGLLCL